MGETHDDVSSDVLSKGMDDAFDESKPETEDVVVEETEETETIAPDVSETEEIEEAVQETVTETETEEEGNRLDPLFGRLKDVSENDRDMISRHYEKSQERDAIQEKYEEAERRIAELEGRDTFTDQAERIFGAVKDPDVRKNHEEFRATHTAQEYVLATERQKVEDQYRNPPPEEDPWDKQMREMQYRLDQIEKTEKEREHQKAEKAGQERFDEGCTKAWGELNVPDKYHPYLSKALRGAYAVSPTKITTFTQLRALAKEVWGEFAPHLDSREAATKESLKKKTTKVVQQDDDEIPEALGEDELDKFEDSTSLLKKGLDDAEAALPESGAA